MLRQDTSALKRSVVEVDTVGIWYRYVDADDDEIPYSDTLLTAPDFYDPTRRQPLTQGHLGFIGTAARHHLSPFKTPTPGFDAGYHAYDTYAIGVHQRRFFRLQRPLTHLFYAQGIRQADAQLEGFIARNLANDVKLVLEYRRITHAGAPDLPLNGNFSYDQPGGNLRSLHVGIARLGNHRYHGIYSFLTATGSVEETGGLVSDAGIIENGNISLGQAPVFLSKAGTRFDRYRGIGKHMFKTGAVGHTLRLTLDQEYAFFRQRFSDSAPDSLFYPSGYLTDVRGLRHYVQGYEIKHRLSAQSALRLRSKTGQFTAGVAHHIFIPRFDQGDSLIQNLWLVGDLALPVFNNLLLKSEAGLNMAFDNIGDYYLSALLRAPLGNWAVLHGAYRSQLTAPPLIAHRADISGRALWRNSFNKTLTNRIETTLHLTRLQLQVGLDYRLINNLIYWDTAARPRQTGVPVSVLSLWAAQQLKWRFLYFDYRLTTRTVSETTVMPMPRLSWQTDVYAQWLMFKRVLTARSGVLWHGQSAWPGLAWQPAVGQFHLNPGTPLANVPRVDIYFQFRHIRQLQFFITYSHAATWLRRTLYYETAGYPMPDRYIRLGVSTLLRY